MIKIHCINRINISKIVIKNNNHNIIKSHIKSILFLHIHARSNRRGEIATVKEKYK